MSSRCLAFILSFVAAVLTPALAHAAGIPVRAAAHSGFGRVVFDWPGDVDFSVSGDRHTAAIHFNRPVHADLAGAVNRLPAYLVAAKVGPDGRSIQFALNVPVDVRPVRRGHTVGIDFVDRPQDARHEADGPISLKPKQQVAAVPPMAKKPDAAAAKPAAVTSGKPATKTAPVKTAAATGPTAGQGRGSPYDAPISVAEKPDFTRLVFPWPNTKHRLEKHDGETVMVFERNLDPDLAPLRVERPKGVLAIDGTHASNLFGLHFKLAPGYWMRTFRGDGKIVLDIVAPKPAAQVAKAAPKPEAKPQPKKTAERKAPAAAAQAARRDAASTKPEKAEAKPENAMTEAAPAAPEGAKPAPAGPVLSAEPIGEGARLAVTWPKPVAAAVFERGGKLWAVFSAPAKLDFSKLPLRNPPGIGTVEQLADDDATVMRMPLKPGFGARVTAAGPSDQAGTKWLIDIVPQAVPPASLNVVPEYHAVGGSRLWIGVPGAAGALKIVDPDVGDTLTVVPTAPGRGLAVPRRFVECTLMRAAQGLVIEPHTDGLEIQVAADTVVIGMPGGLALSEPDVGPTVAAADDRRDPAAHDSEWHDEPSADFASRRAALAQDEADASGAEASRRRMTLALFYLHNRLAAEALGMMDMAARQDPNLSATDAFHAARGQAEMLMNHAKDADKDLAVPGLAADPDALMWRGWALTEEGRWQDAVQLFQAAQMATIDRYSPDLMARFRLAAARASLETGDLQGARRQLAALPDGLPPTTLREAALLTGETAERGGDSAAALAAYDRAAGSVERAAGARAMLDGTLLKLKLGRITRPAAIDRLERLRYSWRGDDTERATIAALGDLYLDDGRYRRAFDAYAEAERLFPDAPQTDALRDRMRATFADLFLNGKADGMEPVKALSLFMDYSDLTPVGREGDDMIRKLADRLASVDLLDQAISVLDYQINHRLDGVAKAQIATKLAGLALLNHDPQRALSAIRETRQTLLPDDLNRKRRVVEAQALMDLGQTGGALEMIARFNGPDVDALRAEIHWRAHDWQAAAQGMIALLAERPNGAALSASDRQTVMKAAISFALAGDQAGLQALRARYRTAMRDSGGVDAFDVLTGPIDVEGVKFRELAAQIAGLDSLHGFLKSYKESL